MKRRTLFSLLFTPLLKFLPDRYVPHFTRFNLYSYEDRIVRDMMSQVAVLDPMKGSLTTLVMNSLEKVEAPPNALTSWTEDFSVSEREPTEVVEFVEIIQEEGGKGAKKR